MNTPPLLLSLVLSLLAALVPAQASGAGRDAHGGTLRIGTWNIEFFGDTQNHRDKLPPRSDDDVRRMGAFVRELGVAVLAVQEICGEAPLRALATAIGPRWDCLLGTTGGWDDGKTAQNIGFLFDQERVELLWAEELLDFPRQADGLPIFHRVPVTACFKDRRTGFDFRAVTVHLKASMKPDDQKKRKLEATVLRDWLVLLESAAGEDQDIVVLGDFNSTYGTDPETVLTEAGAVRYLRPAALGPTILHFPEPIDQIAVSPRFTEVVPASFDVHGEAAKPDPQTWRQTFSDHFPVTVDLRAEGDDDPQATFDHGSQAHALPLPRRGGAAAVAAAAPAADAAPRARDDGTGPLRVGTRVEVGYQGDGFMAVRGTLLQPLGDWIIVKMEDGLAFALPVARVLHVRQLP